MCDAPPLIPELDVADLDRSLAAYVEVLGFRCHASRPEERFAYLIREGVHLPAEIFQRPRAAASRRVNEMRRRREIARARGN